MSIDPQPVIYDKEYYTYSSEVMQREKGRFLSEEKYKNCFYFTIFDIFRNFKLFKKIVLHLKLNIHYFTFFKNKISNIHVFFLHIMNLIF